MATISSCLLCAVSACGNVVVARRNRGPTFTPPRSCEKKVLKKQGPTPHVTLCCNRRITHVHAQHNTTKTRSQRDTYSSFRPGRWIAPIDRIETPSIAFHCPSHTTYTLLVARLPTNSTREGGGSQGLGCSAHHAHVPVTNKSQLDRFARASTIRVGVVATRRSCGLLHAGVRDEPR